MKSLVGRTAIALVTFVIGLAAVTFWYGYYQRTAIKLRSMEIINSGAATNMNAPPAATALPQGTTEAKLTPRQSKYLKAIEIVQHDEEAHLSPMKFENTATKNIDVDLDLGDNIENQLILLRPAPGTTGEFKIEGQFETSFQVSGEGPHIDLRDWKHYRSPWRELKKLEENAFLTPSLSEADYTRFPAVTLKETYRAVLKAGGTRWAREARRCKTLTSEPCSVGVSSMSFRIKFKEGERWKVINQINFTIPMGC